MVGNSQSFYMCRIPINLSGFITASPMCPAFPPTCPRGHVAIVNGCPICTGTCTIKDVLQPTFFLLRIYKILSSGFFFLGSCSIPILTYVHVWSL